MVNRRHSAQSRQSLDARYKDLRPLIRLFNPPVYGWIKAIREALGMSSTQLAQRLSIKQPTLTTLEQSELKGTIQLRTLRRVAEAMNCTLIYALIPNEPLEKITSDQARRALLRRLKPIEHSMLLENQNVPPMEFEENTELLINEINSRTLWNEK
jgi:predicted DNA-binding mobile mystery protein A